MPISWIILGMLAAAPFATYGVMAMKEKITVAGVIKAERAAAEAAVNLERQAGNERCKAQIARVTLELEADASRKLTEALEAERAMEPTPETDAGLKALCARSASCRDRGKK